MTQTTGGMSGFVGHVDFSPDGAVWTAVNGHLMSVAVSGGELNTGFVNTSDGQFPILKAGKHNPITLTVNVVYTEAADEPADMAQDAHIAASAFYVRYSPGGGDAGDLGYTSGAGYVKNPVFPDSEVAPGTPLMVTVVVEAPTLTPSTIGTAGW